jgi:hypothetical protein
VSTRYVVRACSRASGLILQACSTHHQCASCRTLPAVVATALAALEPVPATCITTHIAAVHKRTTMTDPQLPYGIWVVCLQAAGGSGLGAGSKEPAVTLLAPAAAALQQPALTQQDMAVDAAHMEQRGAALPWDQQQGCSSEQPLLLQAGSDAGIQLPASQAQEQQVRRVQQQGSLTAHVVDGCRWQHVERLAVHYWQQRHHYHQQQQQQQQLALDCVACTHSHPAGITCAALCTAAGSDHEHEALQHGGGGV